MFFEVEDGLCVVAPSGRAAEGVLGIAFRPDWGFPVVVDEQDGGPGGLSEGVDDGG